MTDLSPICALGGAQPVSRRIGALTLTEDSDLGLASLALRQGGSLPDLGFPLPGPGGWAGTPDRSAFWTSPGQWMIEFPGQGAGHVTALLNAPGCAVTEQTDGFVAFRVAGPAPALVLLLEKLVNIDAARFGVGSATRTALHHISVFVIRQGEDRLAFLGMRSAAGSLWHALLAAAEQQEIAA